MSNIDDFESQSIADNIESGDLVLVCRWCDSLPPIQKDVLKRIIFLYHALRVKVESLEQKVKELSNSWSHFIKVVVLEQKTMFVVNLHQCPNNFLTVMPLINGSVFLTLRVKIKYIILPNETYTSICWL